MSFAPGESVAAFNVYLKNGQTITEVDDIEKENGNVKMRKYGIVLKIQEDNIEKIEEYDRTQAEKEEGISMGIPSDEKLPAYQRYDERVYKSEGQADQKRYQQLKGRYHSVLRALDKIERLEKKSMELQRLSRKKWSPRKARMARKEKAAVDRELESLKGEKEALLKEKEELESKIR
jgi:hypothetical protein